MFYHHCVFWCVSVSMRVCECVSEVQAYGWVMCVSMSVCVYERITLGLCTFWQHTVQNYFEQLSICVWGTV